MAETTAALLGGFLHALAGIFKRRGAPTAPDPAPSLSALAGARDIQARLIALGLLDPPADGALGPVSRWALGEACRAVGAVFDGRQRPRSATPLRGLARCR
jgi:hypothetical protein